MLLSAIKKLSDKKAKTKNPQGVASKNVYGGVGLPVPADCDDDNDTPDGTDADGGAE